MKEGYSVEEKLSNIAVDLLSKEKFRPFLHRVFSVPKGIWQPVSDCCAELMELPEFAPELFAKHGARFVVTHLVWPGFKAEQMGRMVLFLHDDALWSKVAFFNFATLTGK